jgi:L-serine dehydratase
MTDAYPEFFNDVFGPVMQPGSSSHTAGPCRLGRLAADLLGRPPARVEVLLDRRGSFAGTFGMMAEDRAMVAGALGMLPDDARLFQSLRLARQAGVTVSFEFGELAESAHPNAVRFDLAADDGSTVTLVGVSTGGGMVETVALDGFPLRLNGDTFVLLAFDRAGDVKPAAFERLAAGWPGLVEAISVVRRAGGSNGHAALHVARLADEPGLAAVARELADLRRERAAEPVAEAMRLALLRPLLPVVTRPERKPQLFDTMTEWRRLAAARGLPLADVAVQYEMDASGWSRDEVLRHMRGLAAVMRRQTRAAYDETASAPSGPFKPDFPALWAEHEGSPQRLSDELTAVTIRYAYGAGAGIPGVPTVPGPMGGGGGYIYAALSAVREVRGLSEDDLVRGLFVAAGVGAIAFSRTEPTGERIGCGGECGVCGAMAAAAIVEMAGGGPKAAEDAASLALQATTGLPCDPMPGGRGQPCRSRIMAATCTAHVFADLALAGHEAVLPLHEAIDVLDAVGRLLPPELLCTSRGGAAAAPTAVRLADEYAAWSAGTPDEKRPPGNLI